MGIRDQAVGYGAICYFLLVLVSNVWLFAVIFHKNRENWIFLHHKTQMSNSNQRLWTPNLMQNNQKNIPDIGFIYGFTVILVTEKSTLPGPVFP